MMMNGECLAFMSSMGWFGWLMSLTFALLVGLGITALVKYIFMSGRVRH